MNYGTWWIEFEGIRNVCSGRRLSGCGRPGRGEKASAGDGLDSGRHLYDGQ